MRRINQKLNWRKPTSQARNTKVVWSGIAGIALLAVARALAAVAPPGESAAPADRSTPEVTVTALPAPSAGSSKLSGSELLGPTAPGNTASGHKVTRPSVRRIIVTISERKLALVKDGRVVRVYPVAVGASASPSPTGRFTIVSRVKSPTWYHPGEVVGPGKANPLGTRWMGLSRHGYGIHGTNAPESIGHAASHGCIRMRTRDAEELFELVRAGDSVEITRGLPAGELALALDGSRALATKSTGPSAPGAATERAAAGASAGR